MPAPTPSDPNPADQEAISDKVDEMEERVVGRRVDPPHSSDLGEDVAEDEGGEPMEGEPPSDGVQAGPGTEPTS
jgi:hypothetical protein